MEFVHEKGFTWAKYRKMFAFMHQICAKHPIFFGVTLLVSILDNIFFCVTPFILNKLITCLVNNDSQSLFGLINIDWKGWTYIAIGYIIVYSIVEWLFQAVLGTFTYRVEGLIRVICLEKLLRVDISFYSKNQLGLIMSRTINDSFAVATGFYMFMMNSFYVFFGSAIIFVSSFVISVTISYVLLGIYIGLILLSFWVFIYYRRSSIIAITERQNGDRLLTDKLLNIKLIKSSGTELQEIEKVTNINKTYENLHTSFVNWNGILSGFCGSIGYVMPLITTLMAIKLDTTGSINNITIQAISFLAIDYSLIKIVSFVPATIRATTRSMNAVDRLMLILSAKSILVESEDPKPIDEIVHMELKDIVFYYPEAPNNLILPKTNLIFEKGKKYAFVGETGSGKSSIARLLLRLYDVTEGKIVVNNKEDLRNLDLKQYLGRVGYVEQEPQIIYGNVIENIRYGHPEISYEEVVEASKASKLHDFVMTLPQQYDTILGERGFMLSGGQKQRLVIARIVLKKPDLLILDEATSALDNIVEKEIQVSLDKLSENKTTIAIAHRLSTIRDYDVIHVLKPQLGVVESGSYDELLKIENGALKKLHESGKY